MDYSMLLPSKFLSLGLCCYLGQGCLTFVVNVSYFWINVCGKLLGFAVCCIVIHPLFNFMVGRTSIRNLAFASLPLNSKYLGVFNTDTSVSSSWK